MHESKWAPIISRFIDGDLDERERLMLLQHVAHCAICRETEQSMRGVVAWAEHARDIPLSPAGDWGALRARITRARLAERARPRSRVALIALAASIAIVVTLGAIELRSSRGDALPEDVDSFTSATRLHELERAISEIETRLQIDPGNELARELYSQALSMRAVRILSATLILPLSE